jgi:hypothetical protein
MSKVLILLFGIFFTIILLWVAVMITIAQKGGTITYDCRLAEISPDIPLDIKQKCRKLSSGRV